MHVAEVTAFGAPEVLRLAERPDPAPAPGEVVVPIRAANVNPTDLSGRARNDLGRAERGDPVLVVVRGLGEHAQRGKVVLAP